MLLVVVPEQLLAPLLLASGKRASSSVFQMLMLLVVKSLVTSSVASACRAKELACLYKKLSRISKAVNASESVMPVPIPLFKIALVAASDFIYAWFIYASYCNFSPY